MQTLAGGGAEVQASMQRLVDSALQRLRNWDISETELQRLTQDGKTTQYLTLRSPANGVVLEKPAIQGKRFMAGEVLYQVADLSQVWLLADVFEQDLGQVRIGQSANIRVDAYPEKVFAGKVTFIYPTVTPETRTAKVRIELANPRGAAQAVHVRAGGVHVCARQGAGVGRARFGGARHRHAATGAGASAARGGSSRARSNWARTATATSKCWMASKPARTWWSARTS